jgi:hypothetical protein
MAWNLKFKQTIWHIECLSPIPSPKREGLKTFPALLGAGDRRG